MADGTAFFYNDSAKQLKEEMHGAFGSKSFKKGI